MVLRSLRDSYFKTTKIKNCSETTCAITCTGVNMMPHTRLLTFLNFMEERVGFTFNLLLHGTGLSKAERLGQPGQPHFTFFNRHLDFEL